ncbi:hypothetical protein [Arthrobacter sp. 7Tela_A1]|uniref:hypothetical protein n=1 Tax=Arthrobacter sp. 7Tela_A1 TaxID=3093745 RepID=UPI003BB77A62
MTAAGSSTPTNPGVAGGSPAEVPAPEGAGEVVRHMWDQDWFIWQQVGGTGTLPTGIQAGSAGTWQLLRSGAALVRPGRPRCLANRLAGRAA